MLIVCSASTALCHPKPPQICHVTFSFVYFDRLNNTDVEVPAHNPKNLQKKLSAYGDVCYAPGKTGDLIFFIHTTPAVYHGTDLYAKTSSSAAPSSDGSAAAGAASSSSTTAVSYRVDYSVFALDIEKQQADGSYSILRTFDEKGLYNTTYGIGFGKGKHPITNVIDAGAK